MSRFGLDVEQANAILEMQLRRLTGLEQDKIRAEHAELLKKIEEYGIVTKDELTYCKKMLRSAALTYVAGVTASLLQVLRLVLMFRRND